MDLEDELLVQTHGQSTWTKEASWNSHKTLTVFPQAVAILPLFKSWQRAEEYEDPYSIPEEPWGQETRVSIDLPVWVKFMSEIFFFTRIQNCYQKFAFVCTNILEHCKNIYHLMLHRLLED